MGRLEPAHDSPPQIRSVMRKTGYVYDAVSAKHTQSGHPENAGRLDAVLEELEKSELLDRLVHIPSRPATDEELLPVHSPAHIDSINSIPENEDSYLDGDTYTTPVSRQAAYTAAGSTVALTEAVLQGKIDNGFALVRPPGHHATHDRAMGFCLLNNIAAAAECALRSTKSDRVAIIDFDVHHGNGTQDIFDSRADVLYISSHQYPCYPGTGPARDSGRDEGAGSTVNIPLPPGSGDIAIQTVYDGLVLPVLRRFEPGMIFVSAGFDAHLADPLAQLRLSLEGFHWLSSCLISAAHELCGGRIVFVLEGGYNLDVLRHGVANSIRLLLGLDEFTDPLGKSGYHEDQPYEHLGELRRIHGLM